MTDVNPTETLKTEKHHKQQKLCETRPPYRQGRKLTAVKVYTVSSESQHLFIYGVPKIKLRAELKSLCSRYGQLKNVHVVADYETEVFTECYHVQFERIQSARVAKRMIDNRSFYGSVLHVCYAPEFETIEETRAKLNQRRLDVTRRMLGGDDYGHKFTEVEEDSESPHPILKHATDNTEHTGFKVGKRKFAVDEDIEFQDPILSTRHERKRLRQQMNVAKPEQVSSEVGGNKKNVTYGPNISDFHSNIEQVYTLVDAPTKLIPSQVVRNVKKMIVFRKK